MLYLTAISIVRRKPPRAGIGYPSLAEGWRQTAPAHASGIEAAPQRAPRTGPAMAATVSAPSSMQMAVTRLLVRLPDASLPLGTGPWTFADLATYSAVTALPFGRNRPDRRAGEVPRTFR